MRKLLDKYKLLSKPVKASLWFIMCYVIQRGLQFIGMPIYTRIMSTEEYGIYSVFISWFNLLCVFSSFSIYNGTFNKAMVKYEEDRDRYISSIQFLTLFVSLAFSAILLVFHSTIEATTGFGLKLILLLCIHLTLFPSLQYWSQKQRFLFEYKKLVLVTLINSLASLLLGTVFVLVSSDKGTALITVTVLVQAAINIVLFCSLSKKGKTVYQKEYWKWSIVTAIPLVPHYLSEILLGHADRLMINQMCGASQAGIYNIVYQISMVMTIIRTGINGSFTPWLYYSIKEKKFNEVRQVTKLLTLLMGTLTLLFMLLGPEILRLAAPPSYYEAVVGIPAIMIGCFFIFVYVLFLNVEIYYEQNCLAAVASIVAAFVNVILNYIFINRFGYLAAAYTTMFSYLLMSLMHFFFMIRISKIHRELKGIFDTRFILFILLCLMFAGFILMEIYDYTLIRWTIIILIIIIMMLKRDVLKMLLVQIRSKK